MENLTEKINKRIKNTKFIPRWEFISWEIFKDASIILLFILTVFLLGVTIYIADSYNPLTQIHLESAYLWHSFLTVPWELFIVITGLFVALYFLVRKIHFVYRFNPLVIIASIIILAAVGFLAAETTGLNNTLSKTMPVKNIYLNQGRLVAKTRGIITIGKIKAVQNGNLIVVDNLGNIWTVVISRTSILGERVIRIGDTIRINGLKNGNIIEAIIIEKMPEFLRGRNNTSFYFRIIRTNI